jgi:hypothetical protein
MMAVWAAIRRNAHVTRNPKDNSPGLREVFPVDLRGQSFYVQLAHDPLVSALNRPKLT